MVGKKKKREKNSGLFLSRIGSSLVPNAIFTAVPLTAQRLSETWPRKNKNISPLSTALGSVGNLAQAVVVSNSSSPTGEFETTINNSSERYEETEDYESEGHYAEVDETLLGRMSTSRREEDVNSEKEKSNSTEKKEEVIYATVNKRRKPQDDPQEELRDDNSSGSEDDITSVSGMGSEEDEDLSSVVEQSQLSPSSKLYHRREGSNKRKSSKMKQKRHTVRHISKEVIEEPVISRDINHNINTDFPDGPENPLSSIPCDDNDGDENRMMENCEDTEHNETEIVKHDTTSDDKHDSPRNYHSTTEFEREQFNKTNLDNYSIEGSPPLLNTRREELEPLGSSSSDLVNQVLGERETPIGKGLSSENITSFNEQWNNLEQLAMKQETLYKHQLEHQKLQEEQQRKLHKQQAIVEQHLNELQTARLSASLQQDQENKLHGHEKKHNFVEDGRSEAKSGTKILKHDPYHHNGDVLENMCTRSTSTPKIEDEKFQQTMFPQQAKVQKQKFLQGQNQQVPHQSEIRKQEKKREKSEKRLIKVVDKVKSVQHLTSATEQQDLLDDVSHEEKPRNPKNNTKTSKKHSKKNIHENMEKPDLHSSNEQPQSSPRETLQQMSTTLAKETCRKLHQQVKVLDREKSALKCLSQSLNDENKTLKKLTQSLTKDPEMDLGISLSLLQQQIGELKEENMFLKDSVHRLNIELGRYQAKLRPLLPQDVDTMFKSGDNQPDWLVNKKYVAPLLLAYDDRIKEKQDIIKAYEEELQSFKQHVGDIVQENLDLREDLRKSEVLLHDREECLELEEQAQLVLEENVVLMERQELQNNKLKDLSKFYTEQVSCLSKQCAELESEKNALVSKVEVMKTTLNGYKQELENSSAEWKKHVSLEEHLETVNECRRKLEELKKKTEEETESLNSKLEVAQKENKTLAQQLADYKLANVQLERELHSFSEIQRKNERKTLLLKEKLDNVQEREATAQDTLSKVLNVAEKTSIERDALNEMLASKQHETKKVQSLIKREEDKLKECKNKACLKIAAVKERVKEQERTTEKMKDRYENEIKGLKILIRQQQRQLEEMVNDKRNLENEISLIYQKVGPDSRAVDHVT